LQTAESGFARCAKGLHGCHSELPEQPGELAEVQGDVAGQGREAEERAGDLAGTKGIVRPWSVGSGGARAGNWIWLLGPSSAVGWLNGKFRHGPS